jgi:hypothetical protein
MQVDLIYLQVVHVPGYVFTRRQRTRYSKLVYNLYDEGLCT